MRLRLNRTGFSMNHALVACATIAVLGVAELAMSSEGTVRIATASREAQQLSLVLGKSTVVDVPVPIKRASLADPQIADAIVLSPKQIYVTGKGYGTTNLTLRRRSSLAKD